MPSPASRARKTLLKRSKKEGTPVTIEWKEWPEGTVFDESGRASLDFEVMYNDDVMYNETLSYESGSVIINGTTTVPAFIHYIAPSTSSYQAFAEIESGDAILDLVVPLYRITNAGDTDLSVGEMVSLFDLNAANRALSTGDAEAVGTEVNVAELTDPVIIIDGQRWVQKKIGQKLAKCWDAVFNGVKLSQSLLLSKSA